jgi:hypothetical protein
MDGNALNYKKEETVYVPLDDGNYSIRKFDWNRLRRLVTKEPKKEINLTVVYSILYGITGSAGVSIVPICYANNLPSWVTPLYFLVTLFCLIGAIIFTVMDKKSTYNRSVDLNEIKLEMDEIEKLYIVRQEQIKSEEPKILVADIALNNSWKLNHWGSTCARLINNKIIFEGTSAPQGEDGSHIDINDFLDIGKTYEISCLAKSTMNANAMFRLWCHDQTGEIQSRVSVTTDFKTLSVQGEIISLTFKASYNRNVRVHLQYKPGLGQIEISSVKIFELKS